MKIFFLFGLIYLFLLIFFFCVFFQDGKFTDENLVASAWQHFNGQSVVHLFISLEWNIFQTYFYWKNIMSLSDWVSLFRFIDSVMKDVWGIFNGSNWIILLELICIVIIKSPFTLDWSSFGIFRCLGSSGEVIIYSVIKTQIIPEVLFYLVQRTKCHVGWDSGGSSLHRLRLINCNP